MDLIDRQALLKQIEIDSDGEPGYYGDTWKFIDTIKSMPPATQLGTNLAEVGTDCISRQQAIDAIEREKVKVFHELYDEAWNDAINGCKEVIEQLPLIQPVNNSEMPNSSDVISRQAAIDALTEYGNGRAVFISVGEAVIRIEQLPPIQPNLLQPWEVLVAQAVLPQPKTGKWIEYEQKFMTDRPFETIKKHVRECSLCRTKIAGFDGTMRYCPNCGAKMRGEQNG